MSLMLRLEKVMDLMPEEDILYFSDFKNLPYGPRPQQEVKGFTLRIVDFLIKQRVKAVIIYCWSRKGSHQARIQNSRPRFGKRPRLPMTYFRGFGLQLL